MRLKTIEVELFNEREEHEATNKAFKAQLAAKNHDLNNIRMESQNKEAALRRKHQALVEKYKSAERKLEESVRFLS